jgi:hypothetical protein
VEFGGGKWVRSVVLWWEAWTGKLLKVVETEKKRERERIESKIDDSSGSWRMV